MGDVEKEEEGKGINALKDNETEIQRRSSR
jgi:hypothetical protein